MKKHNMYHLGELDSEIGDMLDNGIISDEDASDIQDMIDNDVDVRDHLRFLVEQWKQREL